MKISYFFKIYGFFASIIIFGIILVLIGLPVLIYSIVEKVRREKNKEDWKHKFDVDAGITAGCILIVIGSIAIGFSSNFVRMAEDDDEYIGWRIK